MAQTTNNKNKGQAIWAGKKEKKEEDGFGNKGEEREREKKKEDRPSKCNLSFVIDIC
jgi:hypothetical protein